MGNGVEVEELGCYCVCVVLVFECIGDGLFRECYVIDVFGWNVCCIVVEIIWLQSGYVNIYFLMDFGVFNFEELVLFFLVFDELNIYQGDFIQVFVLLVEEFLFILVFILFNFDVEEFVCMVVQVVLDKWV